MMGHCIFDVSEFSSPRPVTLAREGLDSQAAVRSAFLDSQVGSELSQFPPTLTLGTFKWQGRPATLAKLNEPASEHPRS